jgi:conjugal transfer mating pair stabilization protein TraN
MAKPPKTNTVTDCSGQLFCQDGKCFDKGYENDPDFGRSMALLEAAREAGTYMDPNSIEIFKGYDSRCKIKLFGLANCCKKSGAGGGMNNAAMALNAGAQAGKLFGSPYMYDAMFASDIPWLVNRAIDAWNASTWTATTSFYGLQFSFSSTAGLQFVGFDPYSFAIQVGIMILQDMLTCEQKEQILAMRRGQNLCHEVGTYCSKKLPIVKTCVEKTKSYCCYNSRLARIINEQGKAQIGKSWGSPEGPNCSGFTPSEFERIDFSKIDLSEFIAEIMANVKMPDLGSMGQQVQSTVQQKMQNYYQRGGK